MGDSAYLKKRQGHFDTGVHSATQYLEEIRKIFLLFRFIFWLFVVHRKADNASCILILNHDMTRCPKRKHPRALAASRVS